MSTTAWKPKKLIFSQKKSKLNFILNVLYRFWLSKLRQNQSYSSKLYMNGS